MNMLNFFEPISLEKPSYAKYLLNKFSFCTQIDIHTVDFKPSEKYDIALIGLTENRGCYAKEISDAADFIRNQLYLLLSHDKNVRIVDLGNIKKGNTHNDSFYAIRDVMLELYESNTIPVFFGSSQDLTYGLYLAFENIKTSYNLTTIDCRIDSNFENLDEINFLNYLNFIFLQNKNLFEYTNIGHQQCYSIMPHDDILENLFYENIRLGRLRTNITYAEPFLRDTSILSIDISSVKHADAPGQVVCSPNGFSAEEICQIAHYAGTSNAIKCIGIFNYNPANDQNQTTAALLAQIIWYFIDGYAHRFTEKPNIDTNLFLQFFVNLNEDYQLKFYKSKITNRWWVEVPGINKNLYISCSESDYLQALKNEIPDRWIKIFKKIN